MAIMIASYFASFFIVRQPYSPFARVISFIPFTAPLSMPNRIAMGAAAWWESVLSVGIALVTMVGLVAFSGRVYERAILQATLGLRDVLRPTEGTPRGATATPQRGLAARLGSAHAAIERRTAMAKREQKVGPRGSAEILILGIVVGLMVWMLTSDVIIGVIAGGVLTALVSAVARSWMGHGGSHLTHP